MNPRRSRPAAARAGTRSLTVACLLAGTAAAQATGGALVVPGNAPANGNAAMALPGFPQPLRVQLLIDPAHVGPLAGRTIVGLRFRRQQHVRAFAAGSAHWSVQLSQALLPAAAAMPSFAANAGPSVVVPSIPVQVPPSSGGASLPWDPANVVTVPVPPFAYSGGTLCIDITGIPDPAPRSEWPVDAVQLPRIDTAVTVAPGCGMYGGGNWSFVEGETLVIGQTTRFSAFGTPGGLGLLLIDVAAVPFAYDLSALGAAPGCFLHLTNTVLTQFAGFSAPVVPADPQVGGLAVVAVEVPRAPWFLGAPFADQWLDLSQPQFAASPAHQWAIAATPPGLGLCTVLADASTGSAVNGEVVPDFAPVLQILY